MVARIGRYSLPPTCRKLDVQAFRRLADDLCYQSKVLIEMDHGETGKLGSGRDDEVGDRWRGGSFMPIRSSSPDRAE